jgi:RNA-directed DNA polymerase
MTDATRQTEDWQTLPWQKYQRNVRRLQQRIYRAESRGERRRVRSLQRLLLRSWSARCLAVRQVSQDNRGQKTPGVDGVASLTPNQRLKLARQMMDLKRRADPVRRVYIPKPNGEQRPLGIPTIGDRARQALVKLTLEPEWEAKFEPNSYGFRPGRSAHDAIEAVFNHIRLKPKWVLDADIEKCFERINHEALLKKLDAPQPITRMGRDWLKAGIMDKGETLYPDAGTPQGGVISPLLANVALHGLETHLTSQYPQRQRPAVIRYADDFVILQEEEAALQQLRVETEKWLAEMGLRLKPSKTSIRHTLEKHDNPKAGFDFLGFNVRQYPVGQHRTPTLGRGYKTLIKPSRAAQSRHRAQMKAITRQHRANTQAALIADLNPVVRGWCNYYSASVAKRIFARMDTDLHRKLDQWAMHRHRHKTSGWRHRRYWQKVNGRQVFSDGQATLAKHEDRRIERHVKVRGSKSPYDGDWLYWGKRRKHDPTLARGLVALLKRQDSKCDHCGLQFEMGDVMEVHHRNGQHNNHRPENLALLHGHCHDAVHRSSTRCL